MDGRCLVIGDLGHVKVFQSSSGSSSSSSSSSSQTFGTGNYLAPEAHDRSKRSSKIDIWSSGCIVYELLVGDKLFYSRNPDKLRFSILNFNIENQTNINQMNEKRPLYVKILKK